MSGKRGAFTTEYKVEAARRVIDSGRSNAEVSRELGVHDSPLSRRMTDERSRAETAAVQREQPLSRGRAGGVAAAA
ncbi:transposase [Nocardia gamkensis]|uniref:transposase n=1 Tax=Nocardia gamkensis TaxID=352869 RepID=UPI0036E5DB32